MHSPLCSFFRLESGGRKEIILRVLLPLFLISTSLCAREPDEHRADHTHTVHDRETSQIYQQVPTATSEEVVDDKNSLKEETVEVSSESSIETKLLQTYNAMDDFGVRPFMDYYGVFLGNPVGGVTHQGKYAHELIFGFEFDFEKLADVDGAMFIASAGNGYGRQLSQFIPNDIVVNEAFTQETIALFNLYYSQELLDDSLNIRVGRMAAGQVFATLPAFWVQANGGINGNPNALYDNVTFTTSSGSTWAGYFDWHPTYDSYLSTGAFQAGPDVGKREFHGVNFGIGADDGVLLMFEGGWKPGTYDKNTSFNSGADRSQYQANILPGMYVAGAYYQYLEVPDYAGGTVSNIYGFYVMGQQMIWRDPANHNHNFSIWGGVTFTPQTDVVFTPFYGFAGTIWQGLIPGRDKDQFLVSYYMGNYGDNYSNAQVFMGRGDPTYEAVIETSYLIQITDNFSFQPDLQYVIRPKGTGQIPNALVLGFQVIAEF